MIAIHHQPMPFYPLCCSPSSTYTWNSNKQKSISHPCHTAAGGRYRHITTHWSKHKRLTRKISATISTTTTPFDQHQMQVIIYFPNLCNHTQRNDDCGGEKMQTIRIMPKFKAGKTALASICRLVNSSSVSIQTSITPMTNINSLQFKFFWGHHF